MTSSDWAELALQTIKRPADAAQSLMDMNIPREAMWTALVLMPVLNTLLFAVSNAMLPGSSPLPAAFGDSPVTYFAIVTSGLILTIYSIYYTGRALGGTGSLDDVMVLMVWLQALRVAVQAVALILTLTIPLLAMLLVLATMIVGLYILLNFINQAHGLGSLGRAAMVLAGSILAILLGLSLLLSFLGGPILGLNANV